MSFNYQSSSTKSFEFDIGAEYYLSAQCYSATYNSSVWVSDLSTLAADLRTEFDAIANLEFRGVGANMVRGDTNSLTIGVGASIYLTEENLTQSEAIQYRTAFRTAILNITGLTFSELRIDTAFVQSSTY